MNRVISAISFAADKHRNQRRKDIEASPYINHPIALANILANEAGIEDEKVLVAASAVIQSLSPVRPHLAALQPFGLD